MLELDLILLPFVAQSLENLEEVQLAAFEKLLMQPDPVLYEWLMGRDDPTDKELFTIVELIRTYHHIQ